MYSKFNHYLTTRKLTSSFVLNLMLFLLMVVSPVIISAVQEPKFNVQEANTMINPKNGAYDTQQLSLLDLGQPLNDLTLHNMVPESPEINIESFNHTLVKKDLKISHQKYRIVKLQSISLILCGFTIISLFTAVLMYRKHHKLISGLRKHGLLLLKDSPDLVTELLSCNDPRLETEVSPSQNEINEMLVLALQEAFDIWSEINGQSLVEFAYQSQIWTITNDSGTLRVRSLERYLSISKIPKNPRWKNVTESIDFVLSTLESDDQRYKKLNEKFKDLTLKLENFYG